ncbi:MAG TPA: inositol monophosphatase family protein [Abditibacteriaceae bacterium]|jgi:fructose-1,6-bisphosphatase/inositol monophosphatase family enzyme
MNQLPFQSEDAVAVVRDAAQLALEMRGRYAPDLKADNTLVTQADREIEEFLRGRLATLAPDWAFLGEETGLEGDPEAPCWVIDPIDGTTNFVRGLPLWCVSVGAVHRGHAIWGSVAVPMQNEIFWAAEGEGAWHGALSGGEWTRLQVVDAPELMQEDLIGGNTTAERGVDFRGIPCRLRNLGSIAYHLTAVARGALLAGLMRQHKLYDIAAGMCLCHEAGCVARYLDGREWDAQVVAPKEPQPLIVAPPQAMEILLNKLTLI